MAGFVTISLDTNVCDICNQDTGEDLINCILNDRCLHVRDNTCSSVDEPFKQAHKQCLDKWKSVVQSSLNSRCPSPKRSWKDKLKDLLNRNVETTSIGDAWFEVDSSKSSSNIRASALTSTSSNNSFLNKEEYRVERINDDIEECLERGRKLRIRSVDIEDDHDYEHQQGKKEKYWTTESLNALKRSEILEIHHQMKHGIEETSTVLISELEEKDALRQQADSLNTTVAQLVKLQQKQNIKTLSLDFEHQQHLVS